MLTLSYINTALSQSAFRIYKCYIIINYVNFGHVLFVVLIIRSKIEGQKETTTILTAKEYDKNVLKFVRNKP